MRTILYGLLFLWAGVVQAADPASLPETNFQRLIEGNQRYTQGTLKHPNRYQESRSLTVTTQEPFAIILGCSDSRVPPEILFDQGIGDLFTVRVAGNVAGPIELASIEYAALYLGSSVLLVLGHKNCGAVKAVLDGNTQDIEPIAQLINPAVKKAQSEPGSTLENAIKDNVDHVVNQLKDVPLIKDLIQKKKLIVAGGYYDLATGKVEILSNAQLPLVK